MNELKEEVIKTIESVRGEIVEIADTIHDNPELGFCEHKAVDLLTSELARCGFDVETGTAGIETAFKARLQGQSGGPKIALLAEYDALPGIGHGCGHNLICSASVGAAIGLTSVMRKLPGRIVVIGTPAEETDGAKVPMVERGVFDDVDAAMMVHPSDMTAVESTSLAMEAIEFTFKGKPSHAAESPHEGIDAVDAVTLMFTAVNALREHVTDDARIHGIITEGGVAPNIIPEKAAARFYIRATTKGYLDEVVEKVKNCARGAALATGAKVTFRNFESSFANMVPNHALAEALRKNLLSLGVGGISPPVAMKGSTDMGNVSHAVPAVHAYIAIGPGGLGLHTKEFAQAAASEDAHKALVLAAKAMAMTAIDILTRPELLEEMKEEFRSSKG